LSSELELADLEAEDLSKEILVCEKKVYETFLGPQPDVEALQKLLLPDYLYIQSTGIIWNKEENIIEAAAGGHNLSTETLTSPVWVKQDDKWLSQLHTSTAAAQG